MAKVFISCGQSSEKEREVAKKISDWFLSNGFIPYVAICAQNLSDVNFVIINELKTSDYYVFIDFKRDILRGAEYRGSLFTNQELAIAYVLKFEKAIFLKHEDVKLEGMTQYMTSNAITFKNDAEVIEKVKRLTKEYKWSNTYSRHLVIDEIILSGRCNYTERGETVRGNILAAKIKNNRTDIAAFNTVSRLEFIEFNGEKKESPNKNLLKVSGQSGYNQIIWPQSFGQFDLLMISNASPICIYLNCLNDVRPKRPIINVFGKYNLYYSVIAEFYPRLDFSISISFHNNINNLKYEVNQKK